jgi:geranylgeranyl diphosphate synthase, type I
MSGEDMARGARVAIANSKPGQNQPPQPGSPGRRLQTVTVLRMTADEFPRELGESFTAACAAVGVKPAAHGYGLVLAQDAEGGRWTQVTDDAHGVSSAQSVWKMGLECAYEPPDGSVITVRPGWPVPRPRGMDTAIAAAVDRLSPDVRTVAAYHLGLADADGRPVGHGGAGGKGLRHALALLSARAAGATPERGAPAAVAVELVHNFSLLHDDIMDGDTERRHRPTAWTVYGVAAAILAGDALLALAQDLLLEGPAPQGLWASRCLSAAVQRLIAGQGADLAFERRDDVTLDECKQMAGDKTAALMACACSIGAIYVGAPATLAMGLAEFGAHVGLAFQLTDDLLDIWGSPEVTGKPVMSDLRGRKKSLPVVAALTSGTEPGRDLATLLAQPEPLSEDELARAAALVEEAGGRAWAQAEAGAALDVAGRCLGEAALPRDVRAEFAGIAEFITGRQC